LSLFRLFVQQTHACYDLLFYAGTDETTVSEW